MRKSKALVGRSGIAVERVILAQTPVDAVVIGVMEGMPEKRTMYLSADAVLPTEFLQGFSPEHVRVAMNRDELGQRLAEEARDGLLQVRQVMPGGGGLGEEFAGGAGAIDSTADAAGAIGLGAIDGDFVAAALFLEIEEAQRLPCFVLPNPAVKVKRDDSA